MSPSSIHLRRRVMAATGAQLAAAGGSGVFLGLTPGLGLLPALISLGLGAVGIGATFFAVGKKPKQAELAQRTAPLTIAKGISSDLEAKIEELHSIAAAYERRNSPLFAAVNGVLTNVQELFRRTAERLDEQEAKLAAVRYVDTLTKLNRALGERYYLDIEAHPELWSDPEERMEAVEAALNATGEQVLRNIRQVNASKDLIYQLSLDSLNSFSKSQ